MSSTSQSAPAARERPGAGTEGATSMQRNRTVAETSGLRFNLEPPDVERVRGYGLCDVLRLELVMDQLAGLATAIDERRLATQTAFVAAQSRWEPLTEEERRRN